MIKVTRKKDQVTVARVYEHRQDHVFRFWDDLDTAGRRALLDQLDGIDFQLLARLAKQTAEGEVRAQWSSMEPAPMIPAPHDLHDQARHDAAREAGAELLKAGKVGALMVAGGQASRLGHDGPKGTYPVGPITGKSLFQVHTEKILAVSRRYRAEVPLYIMTSDSTHQATVGYFEQQNYFGKSKLDVFFMPQRMIPAVDKRGKLILADKGRIFTNPNGHGGTFQAIVESGALEHLRKRGVEHVFYFQVDNPLVVMCDPVFLGYHVQAGADLSAKAVPKSGPEEKVGVFALLDGDLGVLEYSDMPQALKEARDKDGQLQFRAGNAAIHVIGVDFVERFRDQGYPLPYHRAPKRIPYCDREGRTVTPKEPNGTKFETFIFDALKHARNPVVLEVVREDEFSPIKNATGEDSPATARRDLIRQAVRWLEAAGIHPPDLPGGEPLIEVSPLKALDADELATRVQKDVFSAPDHGGQDPTREGVYIG